MRIFLTTPDFSVHGGIRVILEWANRLAERHFVVLRTLGHSTKCQWFPLSKRVRVMPNDRLLPSCDVVIITSPHSIHYQERAPNKKIFVFMQMVEHLFRPGDHDWWQRCKQFYTSPHPMFLISGWNHRVVDSEFGRTGPTHYIGNGVNLSHFPIDNEPKTGEPTVLIEGWVAGNASKDTARVAPQVAARLRDDGYKILAYSQFPIGDYGHVPHEYHVRPSLPALNELYRRATILMKATHFDARACAPVEAMTKGTVTARAIREGDDDLVHDQNCLRTPYDADALYAAAKQLLTDEPLRIRLANNCLQHVQMYTWDYWLNKVEEVLCRS